MADAGTPAAGSSLAARSPVLRYLRGPDFRWDVLLLLLTLAALGEVCRHGLVNFDDHKYINIHVESGVSYDTLIWAFKTFEASNWHPLTWLSLQLDGELFGTGRAWGYHLTNLLLHVANTLLLFHLLQAMTGRRAASAMVAALFAVHPLHVESVAWVSERKDVLSTFFGLLAIAAYLHYVARPSIGRMAVVALALALSLLAKPMLVTLPFLLLLLDYWPLDRRASSTRIGWGLLVLEKLPLVALAAGSCVMTVLAQRHGGALKSLEAFPSEGRLANAIYSAAWYLARAAWPVDLAVYYPYPREGLPPGRLLAASALLLGVTALAIWQAKRRPYLLVGWLWYLGTLLPVIGLVQVGQQARADRYTYVPLIGVFLMVVWSVADLPLQRVKWAGAGAAVLLLVLASRAQVRQWSSSLTLWEHALRVTTDNAMAHAKYGHALMDAHQLDDGLHHLKQAVEIDPRMEAAYQLALMEAAYQNALKRLDRKDAGPKRAGD